MVSRIPRLIKVNRRNVVEFRSISSQTSPKLRFRSRNSNTNQIFNRPTTSTLAGIQELRKSARRTLSQVRDETESGEDVSTTSSNSSKKFKDSRTQKVAILGKKSKKASPRINSRTGFFRKTSALSTSDYSASSSPNTSTNGSTEFRSRSLSKSPQTPKSTGPTSSTPSSAESLPRRRDEALARISPLQGISKLAALVVKNSSSSNSTKINRVKNIAAYRQNLSLNASPALLVPRFVLNETSSDDEDRSVEIPPSSQLRIMPQNDQNYLLDNDFQQITDVSFSEDTEKPVVNSPQIQHWSRSKSRSINESRRSSDSDHEDPPHLSSPTQTTMVLKKPFKSHSALKNNHNFLSSSQMSKTPSSSTITITKILKPSDSPTRSARSKSSSQNDESGLNQSSSPSTSQQPTKSRAITQRRNLDLSPVFNSSRSRSRSKNVESPSTPRNASHESKVSSKSSSLSPSSVSSAPANSSAMASSIYSAEMSLTQSISRAERESSDASVLDNTLLTKKRAELAAYDREIHLALFPPHSDLRRSERLRMKRVKKLQIVRSFIMESILNEEVRLGKKSRALKVNTKHVTFRKNRNPSGETSGVVRISASPSRVEKKKGKASAAKKIMMIKGNKGQRLFL